MLEIEGWNKGTYFIETDIRDILNDFRWSLTSVYGPAKHMSGQGTLSKNQRVSPCLVLQFSPKFYYAKRRFSVTSKCRQMHGVLNVDEIKN
jgi:hypothetical protein